GDAGRGQGDLPDPVLQGVGGGEEQAAVQPQDDDPGELLAPGTRGAITLSPNTIASATAPTTTVTRLASPSVPSQDHSSWSGFEPVTFVPVSLGSSPITTSIAAPCTTTLSITVMVMTATA